MGTKMGFPPGVRIQLKDNSAYTVVDNPYTTAGIVGYASKGELNKIIQVNTTAELDSKLGYGYQSYKYNQGMYAARAVLDAGGVVEFVRPYGEEIDRTDPKKRDLKTDAFVVTYDKSDKKTSFNVEHFAATRYKTDGAATYGLTRKINNIAEAVTSGKNVDFGLTASDDFRDSKKSRSETDMVMFAIVNRDPSYAYRAYDQFDVIDHQYKENSVVELYVATTPTFAVGDEIIIPTVVAGGVEGKAIVTSIVEKKVTASITTSEFLKTGYPAIDRIFFSSPETAVEDGFDYMSIKTAVAGRTVKKFSAIKWGEHDGVKALVSSVKTGDVFTFRNKNGNEVDIRLLKIGVASPVTVTTIVDDMLQLEGIDFIDGDIIDLNIITRTTDQQTNQTTETTVSYKELKVVATSNGLFVSKPDGFALSTAASASISEPSEDELYTDISSSVTWADIANAVVKTLTSNAVGFGKLAVVNDINEVRVDSVTGIQNIIVVDPNAAFDYAIGDKVAIVRGSNSYDSTGADATRQADSVFNGDSIVGGILTVTDINTFNGTITVDTAVTLPPTITSQLINLSDTSATVYNAVTSETYEEKDNGVEKTYAFGEDDGNVAAGGSFTKTFDSPTIDIATGYQDVRVGTVTPTWSGTGTAPTFNVTVEIVKETVSGSTVRKAKLTVKNTDETLALALKDLSVKVKFVSYRTMIRDTVDTYLVSSYSMYVSETDQKNNIIVQDSSIVPYTTADEAWNLDVMKSKKVLADSEIGATFLGLGFAKTDYIDINYDNNPQQVYVLTDEGASIARMYLSIRYRFNGKIYEFEGTIVPYSTSTKIQLGIQYAADYELTDSGLEFVLNDSGILDYFLENDSYDLSQTVVNGVLNGSVITPAFNADDPAIINDAVWTYSPLNNRSGSTLSTVWNLFLNKDGSDVDMLVAAGMAINNPFMNKLETLNTQVMQAMLNVCEARKDCFALFDGVSEPDIAKALKKEIAATGFVSTIGRWGMLYDGRGLVQDSIYTNGEAEIMKSIQMANIITGNRQSGIYWEPPSGYDKAPIPSAWGTKEKFTRTYSAEDKSCDVAKLNDIHVNATRVNREGMCIWGDFTLQMEDTAFNQAHVAMLVAGIHKTFYKYLDHKVFRLNTTNLRAQITSDLQDKLNMIKRANPQGLIDGIVICNDTNNTPELIDQNFLIVDVKLWPTKSARWIILRTSVESTQNGNNISTEIISG